MNRPWGGFFKLYFCSDEAYYVGNVNLLTGGTMSKEAAEVAIRDSVAVFDPITGDTILGFITHELGRNEALVGTDDDPNARIRIEYYDSVERPFPGNVSAVCGEAAKYPQWFGTVKKVKKD